MTVNQLSVFIENKPGSLAAFADLLRRSQVDLRALSIADVEDYGILRVIVNDIHKASIALKNADYVFKITPVLAVPLADSPGSLAETLDALGAANINVEYLYAFVGRQEARAYVIFRVRDSDIGPAVKALTEAGCAPIGQEELELQNG